MPLSTTPGGKAFAIKTLHPSDHEFKAPRLPGGELPSVGIASDAVQTLNFPVSATKCVIIQVANPWMPLSVYFMDSTYAIVDTWVFTNPALGGGGFTHNPASWATLMNPWATTVPDIVSYCVTAQSFTSDLIAPALADQGTIVSAQMEAKPRTLARYDWTKNNTGNVVGLGLMSDVWGYFQPPDVALLLMGTNAYTAKAREGCYQPLKLRKFKWKSPSDSMIPYTFPASANPARVELASMTWQCSWPYGLNLVPSIDPSMSAMPKPTSDTVGMTYYEGIDAANGNVSIRVRFRQCLDIVPVLGRNYAPLAEAPLPPDDLAFKMVKEIAGKMKDGYPASYNDLGKLKDIIASIGRGILKFADPALSLLGTIVPGASALSLPVKAIGTFMDGLSPKQANVEYVSYPSDVGTVAKAPVATAKMVAPTTGKKKINPALLAQMQSRFKPKQKAKNQPRVFVLGPDGTLKRSS